MIDLKPEKTGSHARQVRRVVVDESIPLDKAVLRQVVIEPDGRIVAVFKQGYMDEDGEFHQMDEFAEVLEDAQLTSKIIDKVTKAVEKAAE